MQAAYQGEAECKSCSLRESAVLFSGLDDSDFEHLHAPIEQFSVAAGSRIYRDNEPGEFLYTLRKGLVKLVNSLPDGSQRIVGMAGPTDVIGLEVLVQPHYDADAVVVLDAELCRIPLAVVRDLSDKNPALHEELLRRWQKALREANRWLTDLSTGSARQRIARLLLMLDCKGNIHCELLNREDMAGVLVLTVETVSRIIADKKRAGVLRKDSNNCYICDNDQLKKISYE